MHKSYHLFVVMALSLISIIHSYITRCIKIIIFFVMALLLITIKILSLSYSLFAFNCSLGNINIVTPGKLFYHHFPHVFFISLFLTFCK